MHDSMLSYLTEGSFELREDLPGLLLRQNTIEVLLGVNAEIGELAMFKHQIQISGSLLEVNQLYDVLMLDDGEYIDLLMDPFQLLRLEVFKRDLLDSIKWTISADSGLEDYGVRALADWTKEDVRADLAAFLAWLVLLHSTNTL